MNSLLQPLALTEEKVTDEEEAEPRTGICLHQDPEPWLLAWRMLF